MYRGHWRRVLGGLAGVVVVVAGVAGEWPRPPASIAAWMAEAESRNPELAGAAAAVEVAAGREAEARSGWRPRVDARVRGTLSEGGEVIRLAVGDGVNPAYEALERLSAAAGQPAMFPRLSNVTIRLQPYRQWEAAAEVVQPVYRPELTARIRAARAGVEASASTAAAVRRRLRADVQVAAAAWLQSRAAVGVLEAADAVAAESLRVRRALQAVDRATEDQVLRAEASKLEVEQSLLEARLAADLARAALNRLLDRDQGAEVAVPVEAEVEAYLRELVVVEPPEAAVPERREELAALEAAVRVAAAEVEAAGARTRPTVGVAVGAGVRGETLSYGEDTGFARASVVAEWAVFDGGARAAAVRQAKARLRVAEADLAVAERALELEVRAARTDFLAARNALTAAARRAAAARAAQVVVAAREREGAAALVEVLDARRERTAAELNEVVVRASLLAAAARLEAAAAVGTAVPAGGGGGGISP